MSKFILASSSPRRIQLLNSIGFAVDQIIHPDIDETPIPKELPIAYAERIAHAKAQVVAAQFPDDIVLAADTIVAAGRMILGKPVDAADARAMLNILSGRKHYAISSVCVIHGDKTRLRTVKTTVTFKRLTDDEMDYVLKSDEWNGMSGAYTIQGIAASFIKSINGHHTNVIGLPVFETANLLTSFGLKRA